MRAPGGPGNRFPCRGATARCEPTHQRLPPLQSRFFRLFNSYYKSAGEHWVQGERGQLSRPTLAGIGVESFTDPHERFIDSLWQVNKQVNPGSG